MLTVSKCDLISDAATVAPHDSAPSVVKMVSAIIFLLQVDVPFIYEIKMIIHMKDYS